MSELFAQVEVGPVLASKQVNPPSFTVQISGKPSIQVNPRDEFGERLAELLDCESVEEAVELAQDLRRHHFPDLPRFVWGLGKKLLGEEGCCLVVALMFCQDDWGPSKKGPLSRPGKYLEAVLRNPDPAKLYKQVRGVFFSRRKRGVAVGSRPEGHAQVAAPQARPEPDSPEPAGCAQEPAPQARARPDSPRTEPEGPAMPLPKTLGAAVEAVSAGVREIPPGAAENPPQPAPAARAQPPSPSTPEEKAACVQAYEAFRNGVRPGWWPTTPEGREAWRLAVTEAVRETALHRKRDAVVAHVLALMRGG